MNMKIISVDSNGIVTYQGSRGPIIIDRTEYYKGKGFDLDDSVVVACPHCHNFLARFSNIETATNTEIDGILTCKHGHIFCSRCVPDWHESGEPYCPACQDAAQERFFAALAEHGIDFALSRFDPAASTQAMYRACREKGLDVVFHKGNVYPVHGQGDSLVFENVLLQRDYLPFLCRLFFVNDDEMQELGMDGVDTPQDFARIVEYRPYEYWTGGAGFGTFALSRRRGWVYETLSGRRLYFLPNPHSGGFGTLYCTGLDDSTDFRQTITSFFGVPRRMYLPEIGLITWIQRPRKDADGNLSTPDNHRFWEVAIK
jgi:uncharacterized protein YbaR (Trm112 family)